MSTDQYDAFLEQFPMFIEARNSEAGRFMYCRKPGSTNDVHRVVIREHQYVQRPRWRIHVSPYDHGKIIGHKFDTPEAAASFCLVEGLLS